MNTENTNKKTTCDEKAIEAVLPEPTAKVIAAVVGVSESYVKKITTPNPNAREYRSKNAALVKYCNELIVEGQQVLLTAVSQTIDKLKNQPSNK